MEQEDNGVKIIIAIVYGVLLAFIYHIFFSNKKEEQETCACMDKAVVIIPDSDYNQFMKKYYNDETGYVVNEKATHMPAKMGMTIPTKKSGKKASRATKPSKKRRKML